MGNFLEDLLEHNLKIVFCGMAPGNISAQQGFYYAHKQNRFWTLLHQTGLTDHQFSPDNFRNLLKYQVGLTDLFMDQSGMDKNIIKKHFDRAAFKEKILHFAPKKLGFTSKSVGEVYFNRSSSKLDFGLQPETIGMTKIYILPGTSPANNVNWLRNPQQYLELWRGFVFLE